MNNNALEALPLPRRRAGQLLARGFLICMLVVPLALSLPGLIQVAHAAPLEDCDADGFDDATGVAVPWAGYDETRGDTPAGPGTAEWWIEQNKPTGTGGGASSGDGSSSGSGGTSSGSTTSGSGSTNSAGSSSGSKSSKGATSGTGGKSSATAGRSTASSADEGAGATTAAAPVTSVPATTAAAAATTVTAAASTVTSVPVSAVSSSSAESSITAAAGTAGAGGSATGTTNFWEALTVGFTGANQELFAGLSLLAALALAGGLALGVSALRGVGDRLPVRQRDHAYVEEPAASTA